MTIVSIETAIVMKYSFTETNISKEIWILFQCTECPSIKLNSQSAIILTQFLYQVVVRMLKIVTFDEDCRSRDS